MKGRKSGSKAPPPPVCKNTKMERQTISRSVNVSIVTLFTLPWPSSSATAVFLSRVNRTWNFGKTRGRREISAAKVKLQQTACPTALSTWQLCSHPSPQRHNLPHRPRQCHQIAKYNNATIKRTSSWLMGSAVQYRYSMIKMNSTRLLG